MITKNKKERDWLHITEDEEKSGWLLDRERAEGIGRFVLWLFTDLYGLTFLAFTVIVIYKSLQIID